MVWKINGDKFRIALKVRCDKNISESCCSKAFLQPSQQVVLTSVTAFSKCYQQSRFFDRNSLSNPSAGNTKPAFRRPGQRQRHFSSLHFSHPYLFISEDWWHASPEGLGAENIIDTSRGKFGSSASLNPHLPRELPICQPTGSSGLISATCLLMARGTGSAQRIWSGPF